MDTQYLEQKWREFAAEIYPEASTHPDLLAALRRTFYAGALVALKAMEEQPGEEASAAPRRLVSINEELHEWAEPYLARFHLKN